jgi:nicotinate-nucleotide pyrophosphorylase (carboxylating)
VKLEPTEIRRLAEAALAEDLGSGDITTNAVIAEDASITLRLGVREAAVIAGLSVAREVFALAAPGMRFKALVADGKRVEAGATLARIEGPARGLLSAERTALNLLQHLSGIATETRRFVEAIEGTDCILLDTRKTLPGLRRLAKYATALGGAGNHRMGLFDAVLIKDNHIAVCGGIGEAIARARAALSSTIPIEIECDSLEQVGEAVAAGAERILLDNMDVPTLKRAVAMVGGRARLEASGGVTLATVREIAETGVDFISVGRITLSAPAIDIGLDRDDER